MPALPQPSDFGTTPASTAPKLPLEDRIVQTASNEQIISDEKKQQEIRKAEQGQEKAPLPSLAAYVRTAWQAALTAKQSSGTHREIVKCLNQRNGIYDAAQLREIGRFNGSTVYMMLTSMKCRAAEAWIKDIMLPPGEKSWSLRPSPEPDLPDNIQQQIVEQVTQEAATLMYQQNIQSVSVDQVRARMEEIREKVEKERLDRALKAVERISTHIQDQLLAGGYYEAIEQFITDFVTLPAAFMKGPVIRRKDQLAWTEGPDGDWVPAIEERYLRTYERVSPFDMFPSPGAKSIQDGYLCERIRLRRSALQQMIGAPGWDGRAIRAVITEYQNGGLADDLMVGDHERAVAEGRPNEFDDPDKPLSGVVFNGPVPGGKLRAWGMSSKQIPDPWRDYEAVVVLFGRWVVMARLNAHPLGMRNYYSASYEHVNDSIWGKGVPQLIRDTQRICNAAARALVNNMGIASGPQAEVIASRLMPGENTDFTWPWRIWLTKESKLPSGKPALQFFQPDMLAEPLMRVFEFFFKQASEQSGIPAYMYGNERMGGAGKTASGLSMLMNSASKTLKSVVYHVDGNITKPTIKEHWLQVMLHDPIDKYGDTEVVARASEYLVEQEQLAVRRQEFLRDTNNPTDIEIVGKKGRAAVLRESAKGLKMPTQDIVPSKREMEEREQADELARAAAVTGAVPGAPAPGAGTVPGPGALPTSPPAHLNPAGGRMGKEPGRVMQ